VENHSRLPRTRSYLLSLGLNGNDPNNHPAVLESLKREIRSEQVKFFNGPLVRGPWSEAKPH
jgi:hypothetical protein